MERQKGFTLVEAAVAIGVVVTLSGIIIPLAMKSLEASKVARAKNDVQVIAAALAKQLQDTGLRPRAAGGPGGCDGTGNRAWRSEGQQLPDEIPPGGPARTAWGAAPNNTFMNLFTAPNNNPPGGGAGTTNAMGNALFGLGANPANDLNFRGPYLAADMAGKTDPWGGRYLVLGYNEQGQISHGPVWVVCMGASKRIRSTNLVHLGAPGQYPSNWDYNGASATNIAVRVQ